MSSRSARVRRSPNRPPPVQPAHERRLAPRVPPELARLAKLLEGCRRKSHNARRLKNHETLCTRVKCVGDIWYAECPLLDHGLVRPRITDIGVIVLMCDECGAVWRNVDEISDDKWEEPILPSFTLADGPSVKSPDARWAEWGDLNDQPWAGIQWQELAT